MAQVLKTHIAHRACVLEVDMNGVCDHAKVSCLGDFRGWRSELGGKLKRQQCGPLHFFVAPYRDEDGHRREPAKKCFWAVTTEDIIGSVRRRFFREVESALMR